MWYSVTDEWTGTSQLPFGWVCFSNFLHCLETVLETGAVSIAFRLGLFL